MGKYACACQRMKTIANVTLAKVVRLLVWWTAQVWRDMPPTCGFGLSGFPQTLAYLLSPGQRTRAVAVTPLLPTAYHDLLSFTASNICPTTV